MLEVKNLTKRFKDRTALDNVSLRVGEGEVFGYLGPNGSGKTTTMRVLLGLLEPTSGEALLWGKRASQSPEVRRRTGVLLEADGLYPRLTAYDNLDYFARLYSVPDRGPRIARLLEFAGLTSRSHDKVGSFSRGMRRKLGLVRALLHSPDLLMLDEPSAGLDPEAQKMVRDLIVTLSSEAQITVFLSSHDLDEVQRICGRVAILQHGRIRVCDTLKALQASVGSAGVEVVISDAARTEEAVRLLRSQPDVSAVTSGGDAAISVTLRNAHGAVSLAAVLEASGIGVDELRRSRRSLEEVYLDIVREERRGE
jgi:ABC-2 type transport system ATP-binding protein